MSLVFSPPPSPPPTPAPPEASLSTQERLRLAKRRRAAQLKRWTQREKEKNHPDVVKNNDGIKQTKKIRNWKDGRTGIEFVPNVMLLEAAARNDVEEVRRLLELGVSPDSTNEDGLTALHQCCIDDSAEMMRVLVEYGGNPNATDTEKWTPLHAAATCGHLHLVKFLIDHGADLLAVNADGNMPYDLCEDDTTLSYIENEMAKRGVTQELIDDTRSSTERRMLRDLQAAPSDLLECKMDRQGATPLHVAAANGYLTVVEFLLDNHVTTDSEDNDQWQPIHAAACWGHLEVVELLAQNGANICAKTKNGETPFDICEDPEIKERLIQLKEQRVRLEQPKVRRSRSASTRTQSIRRTSLREKMNVTKKDVQEEKFYYLQTFDAMPKTDNNGETYSSLDAGDAPGSNSKPIVDINDINFDVQQPVLPPRRQPRTGLQSPISTVRNNHGNSSSSNNGNNLNSEKINIHVSVTINPSSSPSVGYTVNAGNNSNNSSPGGNTLADLKKARSMNRSSPAVSTAPSVSVPPPNNNISAAAGFPRSRSAVNSSQLFSSPTEQPPELPPAKHNNSNNIAVASNNSNSTYKVKKDSLSSQEDSVKVYSDGSHVVGSSGGDKETSCCVIL